MPTSTIALVGRFARGPVDFPIRVQADGFESQFGSETPASWPAELQARQYFLNGGVDLYVVRISEAQPLPEALAGNADNLTGLHALEPVSDIRLLIAPELSLVPGAGFGTTLTQFTSFLEQRRIFLILDPPPNFANAAAVIDWAKANVPEDASWCALYFPYLQVRINETLLTVPPSGAMAAIYSKVDSSMGIWKSPAGASLPLQAETLQPTVTQADADSLNLNQISTIQEFPNIGIVPWGARTLDRVNPENRYISPVRLRQWLAASIERSLAFAAITDNGPLLWAQITQQIQDFLQSLFLKGAFAGATSREAYFVQCDASTTSAADIAAHRVNVIYGVAPLRASEFDLTQISAATLGSEPPVPVLHQRASQESWNLSFPTAAGFDYTLEESDSLSSVSWKTVGAAMGGDGTWQMANIAIGNGKAFYRLRVDAGQ